MNKIIFPLIIILIILAGIFLATYTGTQKPNTTIVPELGVSAQVTAEVNKYLITKIVSTDKKVTVYVPANAIRNEGYLVLTSLEPNIYTNTNSGWRRPIVVNLDVYDPTGKLITDPDIVSFLEICFILSSDERNDYINNREDYYVQYYEEKQGIKDWKRLNYSIKSDSTQLCGEVEHLTLFSLAIRGEIQMPTPTIKIYQIPPR